MAKKSRSPVEERLRETLAEALHSHEFSLSDILNIVAQELQPRAVPSARTDAVMIPVSVFTHEGVGALEMMVYYLRTHLALSFSAISSLLGRPSSSLRRPFSQAQKKLQGSLTISQSKYAIPASLFSDRSVSVQRHLVRYLHDTHALSFSEIARFLARDPRTIWTAYHARGDHA